MSDNIIQPAKSRELLEKERVLLELADEVARLRVKELHAVGWYDDEPTINGVSQQEIILQGMCTGMVILTEHTIPTETNPPLYAYSYDKVGVSEMAAKGMAMDYAQMV